MGKIGMTNVYFGGANDVWHKSKNAWDVMITAFDNNSIGLNDDYRVSARLPIHANAVAKAILPTVTVVNEPAVIDINWPDYGVPALKLSFWQSLINDLGELVKPDGSDVNAVFYCHGGHGRTGTALGILGTLAMWKPEDVDPVTWVRENYCQSAIETLRQVEYIENILGVRVPEVHKKEFKRTFPGYNSNKWQPAVVGRQVNGQPYQNWDDDEDDDGEDDWAYQQRLRAMASASDDEDIGRAYDGHHTQPTHLYTYIDLAKGHKRVTWYRVGADGKWGIYEDIIPLTPEEVEAEENASRETPSPQK